MFTLVIPQVVMEILKRLLYGVLGLIFLAQA
jgi:hypothetical protein